MSVYLENYLYVHFLTCRSYSQEMKSRLISAKDAQINEIVALKEKTTLLWNLLDISVEERNQVLRQTVKGFGSSVVNTVSIEFRAFRLDLSGRKSILRRSFLSYFHVRVATCRAFNISCF